MTYLNSIYNVIYNEKKIGSQIDSFKENSFVKQQLDSWESEVTSLKYNYQLKDSLVKHSFNWQLIPVEWSYTGETQQTYITNIDNNAYENTLYIIKDNNVNSQGNPIYEIIE